MMTHWLRLAYVSLACVALATQASASFHNPFAASNPMHNLFGLVISTVDIMTTDRNHITDMIRELDSVISEGELQQEGCAGFSNWHEELSQQLYQFETLLENDLNSTSTVCSQALGDALTTLQADRTSAMALLEGIQTTLNQIPQPGVSSQISGNEELPPVRDCAEALVYGGMSGVTTITASGRAEEVRCDQETDGGGWLIIIQREPQAHQLDFARSFDEYMLGFGSAAGEYWIGLETMTKLTQAEPHELRVEMTIGSESAHSYYKEFSVGPKSDYKLHIAGYDAEQSTAGDALSYHDGMSFSTQNRDRDEANGGSCSQWSGRGGWWYTYCYFANPTGVYFDGSRPRTTESDVYLEWRKWQGYYAYLTTFTMMIRPRQD